MRAIVVACALGFVVAAAAEAATIRFSLVEKDALERDPRTAPPLPQGTVHLFRVGESLAAIAVPVEAVVDVPAGSWTWVAEAPGWVSVDAGVLRVAAEEPRNVVPRRIVWPVVPACRVTLGSAAEWKGLERVDVVSIDRSAVFPLRPPQRTSGWIPAGRFLVYTVRNSRIVELSEPRACRASDEVALRRPLPPPPGRMAVVATARVEVAISGLPDVAITGRGAGPIGSRGVTLRINNQVVRFDWSLPSSRDLELTVRHAELRTRTVPLPAADRAVVELPELRLVARDRVAVPVDYRPKAQHRTQKLRLEHCGEQRITTRTPLGRICRALTSEVDLVPGLHEYEFGQLDTGTYFMTAEIDGERLGRGLANRASFFVSGDDDTVDLPRPGLIVEQQLKGRILLEGKAVPGFLELQASGRRFPTNEDLEFEWIYFAREIRDDERKSGPHESRFFTSTLSNRMRACAEEGPCRFLGPHSYFEGEGYVEIELTGPRATVEVRSAATEEPVAGAAVWVRGIEDFVFQQGEVQLQPASGMERQGPYLTRPNGQVVVDLPRLQPIDERVGRPFREVPLFVEKSGYESRELWVPVSAASLAEPVVIELQPKEEGREVTVLMDGRSPLRGAFLLRVGAEGQRDLACSPTTDSRGVARIRSECSEEGGWFVVFHPAAAVTVIRADAAALPAISVPAGGPPIEVVAIDGASGEPVADLPLGLQLGDLRLTTNDLLTALTYTRTMFGHLTDGAGRVRLYGLRPTASVGSAVLFSADAVREGRLALSLPPAGETLTLVVDVTAGRGR